MVYPPPPAPRPNAPPFRLLPRIVGHEFVELEPKWIDFTPQALEKKAVKLGDLGKISPERNKIDPPGGVLKRPPWSMETTSSRLQRLSQTRPQSTNSGEKTNRAY